MLLKCWAAKRESICIVAILKDEEKFLDEWMAYHRLLGVDHFFLYDNDPLQPLKKLYGSEHDITVIDWSGDYSILPGRNDQTKAYMNSLLFIRRRFKWVCFLDGDEFISLPKHKSIKKFLLEHSTTGQIRLNWHLFSHSGHYEDPERLVITSLQRRRRRPGKRTKTIAQVKAIQDIPGAHFAILNPSWRSVDANGRPYEREYYSGKTKVAHINHYFCRSFTRWMSRVQRGDVSFKTKEQIPKEHLWRFDSELCLKEFITNVVAKQKDEVIDREMLPFAAEVENRVAGMREQRKEVNKIGFLGVDDQSPKSRP